MSKANPILSILIPTFNRKNTINLTLSVLLKQIIDSGLQESVEVYVGDNCSTDGTGEYLMDLSKSYDSFFKYKINNENLGSVRNLLSLVDLAVGKYWMFYGDDDFVPEKSLISIVECLNLNSSMPVFMFKQHIKNRNVSFKDYTNENILSINELAQDYFYYIGNAGVFAVNREISQSAIKLKFESLLDTCWPQTDIVFLTAHLCTENKNIFASTISSVNSSIGGLFFMNSDYFFETMLYSLIRSAISVDSEIQNNFIKNAMKSIYGIIFFVSFKIEVIEHYVFFDLKNEKEHFEKSVSNSMKRIPIEFGKEIRSIASLVNMPIWYLKLWLYIKYFKRTIKLPINATFLNRLKIYSPYGYKAMIIERQNSKNEFYKMKNKKIITSNSGYFHKEICAE
ncbi:MAG: glycosyltransferase family 2 protein [Bacteroidota bacterium]|jgi:glycosyltransferase involved in cell wall biosynthesis